MSGPVPAEEARQHIAEAFACIERLPHIANDQCSTKHLAAAQSALAAASWALEDWAYHLTNRPTVIPEG